MSEKKKSEKLRNKFLRMAPTFKRYVLRKFEDMEEFKRFTLAAIEDEKKSIQKRFDKDTKDLTKEEIEEYYDWNSEDYFLVEDVFKNISMYSFIVIFYSYIESGLNTICNVEYSDIARYHRKQGEPPFLIRCKDMKGEGIKRSKLYLEKVIGLNIHAGEKPWSEIETLRKIRNAIIHDDGTVSGQIIDDGNVKQHINNGLLEITDHGHNTLGKIIINDGYLDFILAHTKQFFENIEERKGDALNKLSYQKGTPLITE
jgi:hypothetical protein